MAAKVTDFAKNVDILLGNLGDAISSDRKETACEKLIAIAKANEIKR